MVRITRRDFIKYCSVAAGALGLSASTLMRLESVLAKTADLSNSTSVPVVWISGAACTGCTMSLLNSVNITTVDSLLIDTIDLKYIDTAMATAGSYWNTGEAPIANSLDAAHDTYTNLPYVLVVEGAIPTGKPSGGSLGDFCKIGDLLPAGVTTTPAAGVSRESMYNVAYNFATNPNCVAILAVGTCSSFGGIPGAQGNVTGAKGVGFTGTTLGGAIIGVGTVVTGVTVMNGGSGYTSAPDVKIVGGGATSLNIATAHADLLHGVTSISLPAGATGYTVRPKVTISDPTGVGPEVNRTATAMVTTTSTGMPFTVDGIVITYAGSGYLANATVTIEPQLGDTGATVSGATAIVSGYVGSITVDSAGLGYTSVPAVELGTVTSGGGSGAEASALLTLGATVDDMKNRTGLAAKLINISGCPPHPDWIVGTIAYVLDSVPAYINDGTALKLPPLNRNYQPIDYGYGGYQCNAGPCPWRYNNTNDPSNTGRSSDQLAHNSRYPEGNSKTLGQHKYEGTDLGCLGILGCKGRKTKADCSARRWNADGPEQYGVNWCVGSRGGCHGCTEPTFPDKVGKFFTFA